MNSRASLRPWISGCLTALMAVAAPAGGWSQEAPQAKSAVPQFPPGPDFTGVAGSAAEHARITALCGPNRNAADGYTTTPAFAGQTRAPIVQGRQGYAVQSVAKIDRPFGMDFLPGGKMLVSFRDGGMRIITRDGAISEPLSNVPQVVQPRLGSGMYDVLVDRNFARNRTVYFTYHTRLPQDAKAIGRIARAKLAPDEGSLTDVKTLREGADIQPRRLVQARDGTLLILSAGNLADVGPDPQRLSSEAGKVLRINTDGSIPRDNPFLADPEADPAVWALGFRDIHAALIDARTGELWAAENTPKGGDELNIIRPGRNYGMPVISYGRQNSGALINGGKTAQAGMEQPLYYWTPSIAPSGIMRYSGRVFPDWNGDLFIGAMSGQQLVRLEMKGERVVAEEKLLLDRCQRIKVVKQGPDGNIYLLTDEMAPKQNEVLRLVPARTVPARRVAAGPTVGAPVRSSIAPPPPPAAAAGRPAAALGPDVYSRACASCHGPQGGGGIGPRIAGRRDPTAVAAVVRHGQGSMPAMAAMLTDPEIEAVSRHLERLQP